jgi:hypothetical protein
VLQQAGTSRYLSLMDGVTFQDKVAILRAMHSNTPTSTDWLNIFNPIKYDFERGWHLRVVWIVLGLLSLITMFLMGFNLLLVSPLTLPNVAFFSLGSLLIVINWFIFWKPSLLDLLSLGTDTFESTNLFYFVLAPFVMPLMIIYGLGYLIYVPIGRVFNKKVGLDREGIIEYVKTLIGITLMSGLMPLIAYFATKALLALFVIYVVVVIWLIVLLVCTGLLLWGSKLHRISHNPLRGIISSEGSSELSARPWFFFRWQHPNRKLKTR